MKNKDFLDSSFDQLVLIPKRQLDEIQLVQEKILNAISNKEFKSPIKGAIANKFIPESTAKEMLGKGTTWFWQKRRDGELNFRKVGNKIYYKLSDIEKLFEGKDEGGLS
ncbi:MAG: helix-turn-helix domain-containing protein [Bacteroidetes bacterium]|jgi:hypothetical protein|nr:helix-turn-helix domain-containing protein [Bacteroidota bacterium]MBT6837987.1 helix-turn-helix domain-containing protein [Bacteroidota bacterium]MBT7826042.1 helix-turn-helix domain-containing protein [Bacteroidota bacterium]